MKDIMHECDEVALLSDPAKNDLNAVIRMQKFDKGEYILSEGEICRHIYFVNTGLVKVFSFKSGKEFIMRFFSSAQLFSIFDSYFSRSPSSFTIMALEDTVVSLINYDDLTNLGSKHHSIESFLRKITSDTTVRMTRRVHEMLEDDATKRYQNFVHENKRIIQRISLGDISRYLGITQQSLSRIRSQS